MKVSIICNNNLIRTVTIFLWRSSRVYIDSIHLCDFKMIWHELYWQNFVSLLITYLMVKHLALWFSIGYYFLFNFTIICLKRLWFLKIIEIQMFTIFNIFSFIGGFIFILLPIWNSFNLSDWFMGIIKDFFILEIFELTPIRFFF